MLASKTMKVASKELIQFFGSPIGYLFLLAFLGFTLFVFFWGEAFFVRNILDVRPMFEWMPVLLIFLSSALTMRMWSEERRSGTQEFILTLPAATWELVFGKFLACWALLGIALVLTLPLPFTLAMVDSSLTGLDWGPIIAGYVAAILLGASYIAVGLFVSARTENQIVALILASLACGSFYLIGSPFLLDLVDNNSADLLRMLGSGSRFESITRGMLDVRDLYFYVSIALVFLALNTYALTRQGWSEDAPPVRHRRTQMLLGLVVANVLVANVWLHGAGNWMRWDVTRGDQYSMSGATLHYLQRLREPLLIRGYFSTKTHPLLAPLVPQMQDLLSEYGFAGGDRVRVEIVNPAEDAELEDEANSKYGIRPVPFQTADRHEASLVNSYFDVLVQYGDEYEVLSFRELIDVKQQGETDLDVWLPNPEYAVTRSIKKVLYDFQGGDSVWSNIAQPIRFTGYISSDERMPQELASLKGSLSDLLEATGLEAGNAFSWEIVDPEAGDGQVAEEIATKFGFGPMAASLFDSSTFYFYLILSDDTTFVQIPIPESFDRDGLARGMEEALKRFASGLMKTVELYTPPPPPPQYPGGQQMPGNQFAGLRDVLGSSHELRSADLTGIVPSNVDVLLVVEPTGLDERAVFAIDQYLMRGGTVVVAASAFRSTLTQTMLSAVPQTTGLEAWLDHHGISIDKSMVLDPQNAQFPAPVTRRVGGFSFQDYRMLDYPFFVDIRDGAMLPDHPVTLGLPQLTMSWVSPIDVDEPRSDSRDVQRLMWSSDKSWRDDSPDVMPKISGDIVEPYRSQGEEGRQLLGVLVSGRFDSFFDESPLLLVDDALEPEEPADASSGESEDEVETGPGVVSSVIKRSPESARLLVLGSGSFVSDQIIQLVGVANGQLYTKPLDLVQNLVDWAVEDEVLQTIRGRNQYASTLPPLGDLSQRLFEYGNYVLALLMVFVVFLVHGYNGGKRRSRYQAILGETP